MNNIEKYKERFFNLMESTMGDVKPLINEQENATSGTEQCFINCMPTTGTPNKEGELRIACCRTNDVNSSACQTYIKNHKKGLKNCKFTK